MPKKIQLTTWLWLLIAVSLDAVAIDIDDVQSQVFTPSCALSGCHNGAQTPNLSSGVAFDSIVNVPSTQQPGVFLVSPFNPNNSYIVHKIEGTGLGSRMPFGRPPLSSANIQLIRDWISEGALADDSSSEPPVSNPVQLGRAYHMTSSTSPNASEVHIINTSSSALTFTGTLYHRSGSQLGAGGVALHEGTVAPQGRLILSSTDLEQRFNEAPWSGPAILDVASSDQFALMSRLSRNGRITNTNCVRTRDVHNLEGTDSTDVSYVRFINDGTTAISDIRATLYDQDGNVIGQTDAQFFETLGPREAIFMSRDSISNVVGDTWIGVASLVLSDNYENLQLMNLNFVNDETFFNFSCFESATDQGGSFFGRAYHMTASTSPNLSEVHIINTSDSPQSFTATLYHKSGSQLGDSDVALHEGIIEAQGRLILSSTDLEQRFNELPWTGPAILDVTSTNSFELMTRLSRNGRVTNTNCIRTGNVHNLEGTDSLDVSYVRFINDGTTPVSDIRGTLYDANGNVIGQADTQYFETLAAREAIFLSRDSISNIVGETWTGVATLVLSETYENLQLMNLNFVNNETFFNFSCYGSSSTTSISSTTESPDDGDMELPEFAPTPGGY